jgi:hypothetical protein
MLYQANEVLASNAARILELSAEAKENSLKAKYAETLGQDAMDLNTWIEKLSKGELTGEFEFSATENQNGLLWQVAPFSAPVSSVDTKLNNKPSSVNNESEQVADHVSDQPSTEIREDDMAQSNQEEIISLDPVSSADTELNDKSSSIDNESGQVTDDVSDESDTTRGEDDLAQSNEKNEATTEPAASFVSEEPNTDNSETDTKKDPITQPVANETESKESKIEENNSEEDRFESSFITELGSGWYEAPGIGTFYDAGNGWIYEPNMGWSYLKVCPVNCSAWLFNENLGWLWFDAELPNMTFANNNGSPSWIFYPESTFGQSDLVFDYTQNSWMEWK